PMPPTPTPSPSACTTKAILRYLRRRKAYSIRMPDRRRFLQALAAVGFAAARPARAQPNAKPRFSASPFSLGVASGYPSPGGFVIWTRLAPVPLAPGGGMPPEVIPVGWEVARDQQMHNVVASGTAYAAPDEAHSLHVEVLGLAPARRYWYRFTAGEAVSSIGSTRTAPSPTARPPRLRFASRRASTMSKATSAPIAISSPTSPSS